jgi:hypothetical protein
MSSTSATEQITHGDTTYLVAADIATKASRCIQEWSAVYPQRPLGASVWVTVKGVDTKSALDQSLDAGSFPLRVRGGGIGLDVELVLLPGETVRRGSGTSINLRLPDDARLSNPTPTRTDIYSAAYLTLGVYAINAFAHVTHAEVESDALGGPLVDGTGGLPSTTAFNWGALQRGLAHRSRVQATTWCTWCRAATYAGLDIGSHLDVITILFMDETTGKVCAKASLYRDTTGEYINECEAQPALYTIHPCELEDASRVSQSPEDDDDDDGGDMPAAARAA